MSPIRFNSVMLGGTAIGDMGLASGRERPPAYFNLLDLRHKDTGDRIKALRKLANLSQRAMAERATQVLRETNDPVLESERITQTDITRLESDPARARVFVVGAVCTVLGKEIPDLLESILVNFGTDPAVTAGFSDASE